MFHGNQSKGNQHKCTKNISEGGKNSSEIVIFVEIHVNSNRKQKLLWIKTEFVVLISR